MLTALGTWFRRRPASGVKPSNDQPPSSSDAVSATTVEATQVRVARWFAGELPAQVALAQASVPALVAFRPRLSDETVPNSTPLAWLTAALIHSFKESEFAKSVGRFEWLGVRSLPPR